jgi:phosphoribosylamine--glycine ligase
VRDLFEARPLEGTNDGVVIEALLSGMRVSFSAFTDGHTAVPLLPARLYDWLNDGDEGPYAPGMGACTSTSTYTRKLTDYLHQRLMLPTVAALRQDDLPYWGILGLDCIVTPEGPRIVTLRSDMRDMEAQVVLPRLENDLLDLVQATITRRLDQLPPLRWREEASVGIALVVQGYPNHFPVGSAIRGLTELEPGTLVFHDQTHNPLGLEYQPAGHRGPDAFVRLIMGMERPGTTITTTGGHVLTVVAMGANLNEARERALQNASRIDFAGRHFRHDIGAGAFG